MKSLKQLLREELENIILNEVFVNLDVNPNELKDVKIIKDNEKEIIITFLTKNNNEYVLEGVIDNFDSKIGDTTIKTIQNINENKPVYIIRFGTYKGGKIDARITTNKNELYLVFRVVFHYLRKYIDKYDVRIIYFISEGDQRFSTYKYIIDQHFKDFYLFNEKDRLVGNVSFMIKKEDYDRSTK